MLVRKRGDEPGGLHRTVVVKRLNTPIRIRMILLTNNRGVVELLRVTVTPVNLLDLKCATVCGFSVKAAHSKFRKTPSYYFLSGLL